MDQETMKARTKDFAKCIVHLCRQMPDARDARLINAQIFRSGTSVGANYRAACRGRTKAEFVAKLGIVLEEADETLFWLELLAETEVIRPELLAPLIQETNELISIFVASLNTAKSD